MDAKEWGIALPALIKGGNGQRCVCFISSTIGNSWFINQDCFKQINCSFSFMQKIQNGFLLFFRLKLLPNL